MLEDLKTGIVYRKKYTHDIDTWRTPQLIKSASQSCHDLWKASLHGLAPEKTGADLDVITEVPFHCVLS